MAKLNVIAITRFLRSKDWPFRAALALARVTHDLAVIGCLPPADVAVIPSDGVGEPVTILQMEIAGGVVRLETAPLA